MKTYHFTLQHKGNTGKTFVAYWLFQYLQGKGLNVLGFDADNLFPKFANFEEFQIRKIKIAPSLVSNAEPISFDPVLDAMALAADGSHAVIDTGAATINYLENYLHDHDTIAKIIANGDRVFIHTVIGSDAAIEPCTRYMVGLPEKYPNCPLVVWLNDYSGPIEMNGKDFYSFKAYQNNASSIHAVIEIQSGKNQLLQEDISQMLMKWQSVKAYQEDTANGFMPKGRVKRYWAELVSRIDTANLV